MVRYLVALAIAVALALLLLDGPLWLGIPLGLAIILLVQKLSDVAMDRSTSPTSRAGELPWLFIGIALSGLALMLLAAAKSTLIHKNDPPSYYRSP
jgi:hypothetical protein